MSCVQGKKTWPPPQISDPSPPPVAKPAAEVLKKEAAPPNYFTLTLRDSSTYTAGLGTVIGQHCSYTHTHWLAAWRSG